MKRYSNSCSWENAALKLQTIRYHFIPNRWYYQTFEFLSKYQRRCKSTGSLIYSRGTVHWLLGRAMWYYLAEREISLELKILTSYHLQSLTYVPRQTHIHTSGDMYKNVHSSAIYSNENLDTFQKCLTTAK